MKKLLLAILFVGCTDPRESATPDNEASCIQLLYCMQEESYGMYQSTKEDVAECVEYVEAESTECQWSFGRFARCLEENRCDAEPCEKQMNEMDHVCE
jgi:hypothetical protein